MTAAAAMPPPELLDLNFLTVTCRKIAMVVEQ